MDVRRGLRLAPALLAPAAVLAACNALDGVGDLSFGTAAQCSGSGCETADGAADQSTGPALDASGDASTDARIPVPEGGPVPSYCTGIVMYLPFENALASTEGVGPETPPAAGYGPGKFGVSVLSTGSMGALYYPVGQGGVAYSLAEGSMAMWLKPQWAWPTAVERVFLKPVPDHGVTLGVSSGPQLLALPGASALFGSSNTESDGGTVTAAANAASLQPSWVDLGWNHMVETWSVAAPTLTFTLNGATRREATTPLTPEQPTLGFLRVGSDTYPIEGFIDDVALWDRPLSVAEIQALYGSKVSLGVTCKL